MFKLNAAGWLAVTVLGIVVVGLLALGARAVVGVNRLRPVEPPVLPVASPVTVVAPATASPTPDPDAAWETFLAVIHRCDALPDLGDELQLYPQDGVALKAGIEALVTDQAWVARCRENVFLQRLAEFGPRNLTCTGNTCEAAVAVTSTGGLAFFEPWCAQNVEPCAALPADKIAELQAQRIMLYRPPNYQDTTPFRLIRGVVAYQEDQWSVTKMEVEVLPELPEASAAP